MAVALSAGLSIMGIFAGYLIDTLGPQQTTLLGGLCTAASYLILRSCYLAKSGYLWGLLAIFISGFSSISPEYAAVKVMAANFHEIKGLATSIPVGTFALSSLVLLSTVGVYFKDDVPGLLMFIALINGGILTGGYLFIREVKQDPIHELIDEPQPLRLPWSTLVSSPSVENYETFGHSRTKSKAGSDVNVIGYDEGESALSDFAVSTPNDEPFSFKERILQIKESLIFQIMTSRLFFLTFLSLTCLVAVGQTYIFSVGYIIQNQYVNPNYTYTRKQEDFQNIQVSMFSFCNFIGRLVLGYSLDIIVARLKIQRLWAILICIALLFMTQVIMVSLNNLNYLYIVSGITGFAFGIIFGTFPSTVSDYYHSSVYSTVWGTVTTGPFLSNAILTSFFSHEIQKNSEQGQNGFLCYKGTKCYENTFYLTQGFCLLGLVCVLYTIWYKKTVLKDRIF